jgi:class 3 adenylate cyclase
MAEGGTSRPAARPSNARSRGERRYLTIAFADISESTRIASSLEAEDYADLLGDLRSDFTEVVARHKGEIVRIDGDGVTMIFGYPEAHEDDGRRATEAAIDLHAAARRRMIPAPGVGPSVRLHTGIHSGLVLVDDGDLVRGRFEMLGDATNVAKRLADLAAADEILVSEATLGTERHFFRTGPRRLVTPRGKDTTLAVFNVFGREIVETRFATRVRQGLAPFVGRSEELGQVEAWLQDSVAGGNRLGVVVGGAGLGKTRLSRPERRAGTAGPSRLL